ncbi:DUF222 domain-containing protein [Microbacterium sp. NPDC087665]|uniref:HNH endonuclease signature motif containing protein n=1 Tax=Microbacterium sp. NPDC087665 TaxID=3364194 RepID=UPI00382509D3
MNSTAELLGRIASDLRGALRGDAVVAVPDAGASDAATMDVLRAAGEVLRLVDAVVVEAVAGAGSGSGGDAAGSGAAGFAARFGCRGMNELVQRVLRTDGPGAARVVKAAAMVHREVDLSSGGLLPARWSALRGALVDGTIGVAGLLAATGPVEQAGPRVGTAERLRADAELAGYARGCDTAAEESGSDDDDPAVAAPPATPEDLRILAQAIVAYLDPDGAEPAEERAMRARGITLGRAKDGLIPIRGGLLPEAAGQFQRIMDAYLNPKVDGPPLPGVHFTPSRDDAGSSATADSDGDDVRTLGTADLRTRPQKQHDALAAALAIAARHDDMPRLGGAAPTLVVSVTAEDYATGRGWAHVDGIDTPVPITSARHTACGGSVQRVLFDPEGRIIGIGTTDRIFTTHQRRAIALRDQECLIPGCHVPAAWCEIHHVEEHARGGPTSTDNGVALCWHHHRTLDTSGWEIRMQNGIPQVRGPAWWDPHRRWRQPQPAHNRAADHDRAQTGVSLRI